MADSMPTEGVALPCPCCGGKPQGPDRFGGGDERSGYNFHMRIICAACGLQVQRKSKHDKAGWESDKGEARAAVLAAWNARSAPEPAAKLTADSVEWVVNDNAELGVKIGNQFFFLYKGYSLVYKDAKHDDGSQMRWRPVFKREFGECCHPVNYEDLRKCGHQHMIGTVSPGDSDEWQDLPASPETKEGK